MTAEERKAQKRLAAKGLYEKRKSAGLCPMCGLKPDDGVLCDWCCERIRENTKTPEMREWRSDWEKSTKQRKFRREQKRRQRLATATA